MIIDIDKIYQIRIQLMEGKKAKKRENLF